MSRPGSGRTALRRQARTAARGGGSAARRRSAAISSSTCRGKPGPPAGRAQARREHPIEIDPVVRLHYVEVREPDMHEPSSDFRRLQEALAAMGRRRDVTPTSPRSRPAEDVARRQWKVTVALRKGRDIVAIFPGFTERAFGVADRRRLDHHRRTSLPDLVTGGSSPRSAR